MTDTNLDFDATAEAAVAQFKALNEREVALTTDLDTVRTEKGKTLGLITSLEKILGKALIKRPKAKNGKGGRSKGSTKKTAKGKGKGKGGPGRQKGSSNGSGITNLLIEDLIANGPSKIAEVGERLVAAGKLKEDGATTVYQRLYSTTTRLKKGGRIRSAGRGVFEAVVEETTAVTETVTEPVAVVEPEEVLALVEGESIALLPGLVITEVKETTTVASDVSEG